MHSGKTEQIRATRFESFIDSYSLIAEYNGESFELQNLSDTGAKLSARVCNLSVDQQSTIRVLSSHNRSVFECQARVVWVQQEENVTGIGVEFTDRILPREFLQSLDMLLATEFELENELDEFASIPEEFRQLVSTIENFFVHLKHHIDSLEGKVETRSLEAKDSLMKAVDVRFGDYVSNKLLSYSQELYAYLEQFHDKPTKDKLLEYFRRELNQFYLHSPYGRRAFEKPLGYAGDYEVMNQIYRDTLEGGSLFAKIIHRYGMQEPAVKSVRERKFFLASQIESVIENSDKNELQFCSIACGPAQEWAELLKRYTLPEGKKVKLLLVDQDIEALLEARRNIRLAMIESEQEIDVSYEPVSVRDVLEQKPTANSVLNANFDYVYSAGLYDYLPQPVAQLLTHLISARLNVGGTLLVGNFHPSCTSRAICELSSDWRLIYRTAEEVEALASGIKDVDIRMEDDSQGHVVYMHITRSTNH